ncbi:DUF2975 domain-containing protein [Paenibacillus psychroresistens]|uniref:DUF2975 domain-containing protein n=1 Tax=Paenibacillus psychroresistens TaxID=1778678 RepID=A0A6B8RVZ1_9BACL|nr:DUF2975 domain-containing protein [Paenibacillus psychroresistens]QGR00088.1 DUF2975 domain-containing protein [Paenibacillus psychroresistens]
MERGSTLLLKVTVCFIGIPIIALCIFWLPWIAKEVEEEYSTFWLYPALIGLYVSVVPFFVALYQSFRLLSNIDKNKAFSDLSVRALKNIKYCAFTISILQLAVLPLLYIIADADDAPGLIIIGMVIPCASFVIAVFAAVLQKLLKNAIEIKLENDLTV